MPEIGEQKRGHDLGFINNLLEIMIERLEKENRLLRWRTGLFNTPIGDTDKHD